MLNRKTKEQEIRINMSKVRMTEAIRLTQSGVMINSSTWETELCPQGDEERIRQARKSTMAYRIMEAHNRADTMDNLMLQFDAIVSPDNNYTNILQTAKACGVRKFPIPYVLSNCHHTLSAVGGTINEDDHVFGLSNVKKFGGIFIPKYAAVIHQYMREQMAGCGKMIMASDSHARYGALGTMGIGEGGGEVAKQLLGKTYDLKYPEIVAVRLSGKPMPGVGPMDVALTLIAATFANDFNKNRILEFIGDGIANLSMEFRMGIDVMTTESAALSSIWCTDEQTRDYLREHGREQDYQPLSPGEIVYYDHLIELDLGLVEPMIALPFHPSNAMPIREFKANAEVYLREIEEEGRKIKKQNDFQIMDHLRDGKLYIDQALISGCAGGMFENIAAVADILNGFCVRSDKPGLGINPSSLPVMSDLMAQGIGSELAKAGVTLRPCICGPCFGVTDVPGNNQLSIRHVTRNYPNREGSKPGQGQMAGTFLMDARSIAATVRCGGALTAATELPVDYRSLQHHFDREIYEKQVFDNYQKGDEKTELVYGPNIADWPQMYPFQKRVLLKVAGSYQGSVTTDELIPSGEASSFRSNPEKISEYTMISRDPDYVAAAKKIREEAEMLRAVDAGLTYGSILISDEIGDGSSREQAASCQKVLGGYANLSNTYATKRYRSNLINWGILPLRTMEKLDIPVGAYVYIPDVCRVIREDGSFNLYVFAQAGADYIRTMLTRQTESVEALEPVEAEWANLDLELARAVPCTLDALTEDEKEILLSGCLINYNRIP